jgi:HEAT repeat protein
MRENFLGNNPENETPVPETGERHEESVAKRNDLRSWMGKLIYETPKEEIFDFLKESLWSPNTDIRRHVMSYLDRVPEEKRGELCKIALDKDQPSEVRGNVILFGIKKVPQKEKAEIIEIALNDTNLEIQAQTAFEIDRSSLEGDELNKLKNIVLKMVLKALESKDEEIRENAITMSNFMPEGEQEKLRARLYDHRSNS